MLSVTLSLSLYCSIFYCRQAVDPEKDVNHHPDHRDRLFLYHGLGRGVLILRHLHIGDPDPDPDLLPDRGDYIMIHIIRRDRGHVHGTEWMSIHDTDSLAPDLLITAMMIMAISIEKGDTVIEIVIILHIVFSSFKRNYWISEGL